MKIGKDYIGVGVGAFILNENNELLLQKRAVPAEKDHWCIPGGRLEMFEILKDAVIRETKEETDLDIEVITLMGICDHIIKEENAHWVAASYLCKIKSGTPKIMEPDKASDMRWFKLNELPEKITITTKKALHDYKMLENKNEDLRISDMMKMQNILWENNKDDWDPMEAKYARNSLLWMMEEVGEVVAIIKKKSDNEIMNNEDVRKKFVEEMCDVLMYYNDTLLRYGVTAEEISNAYIKKHNKNIKRDFKEEYKRI